MEFDKSGTVKLGLIWEFGRGTFLADHKTFISVRKTFARHPKKATAVGLSVGLGPM